MNDSVSVDYGTIEGLVTAQLGNHICEAVRSTKD
jgi:hypothetical protein